MIVAALPQDEHARLKDLESYEILDSGAESDFDDLVELASHICQSPISLITLLDKERQWFKAKKGMEDESTSRDIAFCSHAILQDETFVVEDARKDARFINNPLVKDETVRFYAGTPILSPTGYKLGTLCVIDNKPRRLNYEQEKALALLSNQVTKLLELRRKNKVMSERAQEIIALKTKNIGTVIKGREDDRRMIATTLHENLAQRLATSLIYLELAKQKEDQAEDYLLQLKNEIKSVMSDMRNLTYAITPYISHWISADKLVAEFAENIAKPYAFDTDIIIKESIERADAETALTAIRVIELWFELISTEKSLKTVSISISYGSNFDLLIEDDAAEPESLNRRQLANEKIIEDRILAAGGTISIYRSIEEKNILNISLPLSAQA